MDSRSAASLRNSLREFVDALFQYGYVPAHQEAYLLLRWLELNGPSTLKFTGIGGLAGQLDHHDPEVPVAKSIAQEEEPTFPEHVEDILRRRHLVQEGRIVVFGDQEMIAHVTRYVTRSVHFIDKSVFVSHKFRRVGHVDFAIVVVVRLLKQHYSQPILPLDGMNQDCERLVYGLEGLFDQVIVVGGDDQQMGRVVGQQTMDRPGLEPAATLFVDEHGTKRLPEQASVELAIS